MKTFGRFMLVVALLCIAGAIQNVAEALTEQTNVCIEPMEEVFNEVPDLS